MEIEGDCLKIRLKEGVKLEIGRGLGSDSTDRTVSRCHVCFQLLTSHNQNEIRARFEVIGMNPIWVQYSKTGEIKMYTSLETGEMESGDKFCVSAKKPIWLTLKRLELEVEIRELGLEIELDKSSQIEELDVDSIDISALDPVKEFGFVVMGHEFDCYPKIHNIKNWNWFIEEHGEESENDEVSGRKGNGGRRRKRKKKGGDKNDDDEWTDENEEVKEVLAKSNKVNRPKYLTRSKGSDRPVKVAKRGRNSPQIDNEEDDEEEEEDEDDETLGGFIVDEDSAGEEPDNEEEDDEEEEFDEEDDEE